MLLDKGCDVNEISTKWQSALLVAAMAPEPRNAEIVHMLLEAGADPNGGASPGSTVQVLAKSGRMQSIQTLIEHGADVNIRTASPLYGGFGICSYGSALAAAAAEGYAEVVDILLAAGANVDLFLDNEYGSALAAASHCGQIETARLLLDRGANVNLVVGGRYESALEATISSLETGETHIFQLLTERGTDVNLVTGG
jgi:ankyrin repeat protein